MPWSPAGDLRGLLSALLAANRSLLQGSRSSCCSRNQSTSRRRRLNPPSEDATHQQKGLAEAESPASVTIGRTLVCSSHAGEDYLCSEECTADFIWIPERVCQSLLRGTLRGLSYLHSKLRNVIHRDIKPDNILLDLRIDDLIKDIIQVAEFRRREQKLSRVNLQQLARAADHFPGSTAVASATTTANGVKSRKSLVVPVPPASLFGLNGSADDDPRILSPSGFAAQSTGPPSTGGPPDTSNERSSTLGHHSQHLFAGTMNAKPTVASGEHLASVQDAALRHHTASGTGVRLDITAANSSEVSSAADTLDQYTVDTPCLELVTDEMRLLGGDEHDDEFVNTIRPADPAAERRNAWHFLHVLLWMLKDRQEHEFSEILWSASGGYSGRPHSLGSASGGNRGGGCASWLPPNLFDHLSTDDILNVILKHTQPKITDFGLSKILAPPEPHAGVVGDRRLSEVSACSTVSLTANDRRPATPGFLSISPRPPGKVAPSVGGLSTHANERMGTEAYAAPEVIDGAGYTTSADMWSLGVVAYQLLSSGYFPSVDGIPQCPGAVTFEGLKCNKDSRLYFVPKGLWSGVPEDAKNFVANLLVYEPDSRPTAEECLCHPWLATGTVAAAKPLAWTSG